MTASMEQVADNTESLSQIIETTAAAVSGLVQSVEKVRSNIHEAAKMSKQAVGEAKQGGESLSHSFKGMKNISVTS